MEYDDPRWKHFEDQGLYAKDPLHRWNCDSKTIIDFYLMKKDHKMLETISNLLRKSENQIKGTGIIMSNIFQICETGETMKIFQWFL